MKLTDENKTYIVGAILAIIFAATITIAAIGAVKAGRHVFGEIGTVSGYGIDKE
jgi:hypothetical protein